jgi:hypothetical protein
MDLTRMRQCMCFVTTQLLALKKQVYALPFVVSVEQLIRVFDTRKYCRYMMAGRLGYCRYTSSLPNAQLVRQRGGLAYTRILNPPNTFDRSAS